MHKLFSHLGVRFLLIAASCTLLTILLLPVVNPPFGLVFASLALASLFCCIFIKKTWVTYVAMVCLPLFTVASVMEFHLLNMRAPTPPTHDKGDYKSTWNLEDPIRGYGPKPGPNHGRSQVFRGDTLLYDVVYTTDKQGRRITPTHTEADTAVVFFGCSYTIGEGVRDEESYPYQVGQMLGARYQTFNYGFHGQGSHHFLGLLEGDVLDDIAKKYSKIHVYFLNIWRHEMRSAGYSDWDKRGPRYALEKGKAVRKGHFDHWRDRSDLDQTLYQWLKQSFIYREAFTKPSENTLKDLRALDRGIFLNAREMLSKRYPGANFTVIVYPDAQSNVEELRASGLEALDTAPFFPLPYTDARYSIPGEWHPSAEAHRVLAEGIAKHVQSR